MKRFVTYPSFNNQQVMFCTSEISYDECDSFARLEYNNVAVRVENGYAETICPRTHCDECVLHYYDNEEGCCLHAFSLFKKLTSRITRTKALS